MDLITALEEQEAARSLTGQQCKIARLTADFDDKNTAALSAWCDSYLEAAKGTEAFPRPPLANVAVALTTSTGTRVSDTTLRYHATRQCCCYGPI